MRKLVFVAGLALVFMSCNSESSKVAGTTEENVTLPMPVSYPGKPAIGKMSNVVTVMNWNRLLSSNKIDSVGSLLADSVTFNLWDGSRMNLTRDSAIAVLKGYMASMSRATIEYSAAVPLDNTDAGDEWVVQWTHEQYEMKDGTVEDHNIHESYLLKDGKIRRINQYAQQIRPAGK